MEKVERRGFLRVYDVLSLNFKKISPEDSEYKPALTADIGGGGIRIICEEDLPEKTRLKFNFELPAEPSPLTISCIGEVEWKEEKIEEGKRKFIVGICFVDIDEDLRQKIIRYVFRQHYELRKTEEVAIKVENLVKNYDGLQAVDNISFEIRVGEIFALLGPNGAGKTTTTRILATLLKPTLGKVNILGFDLLKDKKEIRRLIGYMPQTPVLYEELTAQENLQFFGKAYGLKKAELDERIDEVLTFAELLPRAKSLVRTFSGGMKQRLSLACALIHKPKILFLDEPTAGVDLRLRQSFWEYFYELSQTGATIFITTHQMDEVEYCHRLAFMQTGKIILDDTPQNIKRRSKTTLYITVDEEKKVFEVKDYTQDLPQLINRLRDEGKEIKKIEFKEQNLEMIFRELIKGKEMRD